MIKRPEVAKLLSNQQFWIADIGPVRYAYTRYWAAPVPECVTALLRYWNLDPEPGSYDMDGKRATFLNTEYPPPALAPLLVDLPKNPVLGTLLVAGHPVLVDAPGLPSATTVLTGDGREIFVSRAALDVMTDGQWRDRLLAGVGPLEPVAVWNGDVPSIIMPIRLGS